MLTSTDGAGAGALDGVRAVAAATSVVRVVVLKSPKKRFMLERWESTSAGV